ncbi:MAG: hypothetical protein SNJ55_06310 [Chloroherpetonaceae bacterium]
MERGTILFHNRFQFTDGETGGKLLVVLNTPKPNEPYLLIRTTSKVEKQSSYHKRQIQRGCNFHLRLFYITPEDKTSFVKPTLLQFDEIFPFNDSQLLSDKFKGVLEVKGKLPENKFNEIMNCVRAMKDDIEERYFKMLFP